MKSYTGSFDPQHSQAEGFSQSDPPRRGGPCPQRRARGTLPGQYSTQLVTVASPRIPTASILPRISVRASVDASGSARCQSGQRTLPFADHPAWCRRKHPQQAFAFAPTSLSWDFQHPG